MRINTGWLRDYLASDCQEQELLDAFMTVGLEVEEEFHLAEALAPIRIGFIREKKPLGDTGALYECQVEIEKGKLITIVCASSHPVEIDWGVPVAVSGTKLPSGALIGEGKFKGIKSEGMLCLDGELGLIARSTGLQVFKDEAMLGASLPSVSPIEESLVEVSVLPNRPDCLGMIGVAREVAAVLGMELKYPSARELNSQSAKGDAVTVKILDESLCSRYTCQVFDGVQVRTSPHWLQSRLQTAGLRPINNVVDITNFVMLEWGQPLHAFDFDSLTGNKIEVRRIRNGEKLKLLDEAEVDATHEPLVIADGEKPIALAGIMGGWDSQTTTDSKRILLEAACFDPVCIRTSARKLRIGTDSSYRFERGTDPNGMLSGAFNRAAELLQDAELSAASPASTVTDSYPSLKQSTQFTLSAARVSKILGANISDKQIKDCLTSLEMQVEDDLTISVPTWRVDVNNEVVLAEDVARLLRYDSIDMKPMMATTTKGRVSETDGLRSSVAGFLTSNGFLECRTPPLTTEQIALSFSQWPGDAIQVQNPISKEMTTLRQSLVGSLVEVAERNARRGASSFRFFEVDRTFRQNSEIDERWMLGGVLGGPVNDSAWIASEKEIDFLRAKGLVENLLSHLNVDGCTFASDTPANGYRGEEFAVISQGQQRIGALGRIDLETLGIKDRARVPLYGFELDLTTLITVKSPPGMFKGLARTQVIARDISIVVPSDLHYAEIESSLEKAFASAVENLETEPRKDAGADFILQPELESVICVDTFSGESVGEGAMSLTIRMLFRDALHTLTSGEAQQLMDYVVKQLQAEYGVVQR
ncbi:phenylalanine--tRNA ligase subunit beta [Gimesia maris]|uniref:phenylalanine--tRNA ligase subunit beta n=1 Tax=Gimesia maris TaxID=122 RepID=UPI00241CA115|nr:phenylalanine--tRNA ligase subunit beta [Gimesia maris]|tara:strand:+ start:203837 stop:206290 length:2454 start_codon:yes stop_codon:yes gene_type:complete